MSNLFTNLNETAFGVPENWIIIKYMYLFCKRVKQAKPPVTLAATARKLSHYHINIYEFLVIPISEFLPPAMIPLDISITADKFITSAL